MSRKPNTPPVNARGVFVCTTPYTLPLNAVFKSDAVRTFKELQLRNIDVFSEYYEPKGLTRDIYEADVEVEASIVTLKSSTGEFIYVPDTYIQSYPGMNGLNYVRTGITLDFNLHMYGGIDLDFLKKELADVVKKNVGVECTPFIVSVPYEGTVSHDQHIQMEAARQNEISNYKPIAVQLAELTVKYDAMEKQNVELMRIIAAHPELGTPVPNE